MTQSTSISSLLSVFDSMPENMRVRLPVVRALYGDIGIATVWRRVKDGKIPAPIKEDNTTSWLVGDLRVALAKRGDAK